MKDVPLYCMVEVYRLRCYAAQKAVDNILTEDERLFAATQPKAIRYDMQPGGGAAADRFAEYVAQKEKHNIDERLAAAKKLLEERTELLDRAERQLRRSKDLIDRVYCMRHLDQYRVQAIALRLNYSEAQIYRVLRQIRENINLIKNDRFPR